METGGPHPPGEEFRAGEWIVRPAQCRIARGTTALHVRPMLMDLLVLLASHPGKVVSKHEILERVWNSRCVVDSVLTRDVAELRQCLGDDRRRPRYIETLPKRGYRFIARVEDGSRCAERTIAVLLFDNLGSDPDYDAFAEGMSDAIITSLSRSRSFRVISRQSVMHLKGSRETLPEIARGLRADAIVEGSILHTRDDVRVTAQLIAFGPERHLWARVYDRATADLLRVQTEIARSITESVRKAFRRSRALLI